MEKDFWRDLEQVFYEAEQLGPRKRQEYLEEACAGREDLKREVESLLDAVLDDDFLEAP